jgi:hypothetical protein
MIDTDMKEEQIQTLLDDIGHVKIAVLAISAWMHTGSSMNQKVRSPSKRTGDEAGA